MPYIVQDAILKELALAEEYRNIDELTKTVSSVLKQEFQPLSILRILKQLNEEKLIIIEVTVVTERNKGTITDRYEHELYYISIPGLAAYRAGGYKTVLAAAETRRTSAQTKLTRELRSLSMGWWTNLSTIAIGVISTVFIVISTVNGCHDKTDQNFIDVNDRLKQTQTSLDSLRSTIGNLKPISSLQKDSINKVQTKK